MARPFDIVLWGCTGFTGKLVAKYFAKHVARRLPNLRWALAGRSKAKLQALVDDIDVAVPVMIASSDVQDDQVAAATRVILSTAGPFAKYGSPVVEACVRSGCDYVDINGEVGWHKSMIERYDDAAAEATGMHRLGFLTPATALGPLLQERLHAEGIRFEAAPLPDGVLSPDPDTFR